MLDLLDTVDPAAPSLPEPLPLSFRLDAAHEAHEPPEASGRCRDDVRLLVSRGDRLPLHARFTELPDQLVAGDLLVVNTSATVAAAIDVVIDGVGALVLHVSNELPGGVWMVEPRRRITNGSTEPMQLPPLPVTARRPDGAAIVHLLRPAPESSRLWLAVTADGVDLAETMAADGRPIRYSLRPARLADRRLPDRVRHRAGERRDAERGAAAHRRDRHPPGQPRRRRRPDRPAHGRVVARRATSVPTPSATACPRATAELVNATHRAGRHVVAVGTTVVRALETVTDADGTTHPGAGWTDVVDHTATRVRAVDGLLTGWHEPDATHLAMLEAVAGREVLMAAYEAAFVAGYQWHEFGDSHLLLPDDERRP